MAKFVTFNSIRSQNKAEKKLDLKFENNIYSFSSSHHFFQISDKNADLIKNDTGVKVVDKLPNPEKYGWMGPGLWDKNKIKENKMKNILQRLVESELSKFIAESKVIKETDKEPKVITDLRDVIENGYKRMLDPKTKKRMVVDSYTANAIVKVYELLNDEQKQKYVTLGLLKMQSIAMSSIKHNY